MKNPFSLKNGIAEGKIPLGPPESPLDFEESFLDEDGSEILERKSEDVRIFRILWPLLLVVFVMLLGRLSYLTFAKHEYYASVAEGNRLRIEYVPAPRGGIYDEYGQSLGVNRPSFELVANFLDIPKEEAALKEAMATVAAAVHLSEEEIGNILEREQSSDPNQSILIKQNLSREEALVFLERAGAASGFRVVNAPIRDYKDSFVFSHLIGYVGKVNAEEYLDKREEGYHYNDSIGKTGLELIYEDDLRGTFGQRQVEVDARGAIQKVFGEKVAQPGKNLYLNIDAPLQKKLYETLSNRIIGTGRKSGAAIAMNPQNGRILALVSFPGFDNNLFAEGISAEDFKRLESDKSRQLFNRAVAGTYPPGSTVKPMVAAAALNEGIVNERTIIEDKGYIVIPNIYGGPDFFFYGYNRVGLGRMDVRSAIAFSSDIYFYVSGGGYEAQKIDGLGIDRLAEYFRKFKLGEPLGIDLPGEASGLVPTLAWKKEYFAGDEALSRWYLGDTYHVSIGQGDLLATPLQVLSWTVTLANGGTIWRPFIVDRVEDQDGRVIQKNEPQSLGALDIDQKNLEIVREGMRQVVTDGTAKSLQQLPITSAGKTGTAQFDAKNLLRTHAWFTAFAPYENPEIAIVVLIEDGGEGGTNSVPVAREVLDWWARERFLKK